MEKTLFDACERCMQDEPAALTARCPIHVDVAQFAGEMEKGNFKKAYKILEKRMPLAGIVGMICDHPCEAACVRSGLDEAIGVCELERAAVAYGYAPFVNNAPQAKSKGKIAVAGGGLSGLSAAFELRRKGFSVTIFEKSDRLGGCIWEYAGKRIDAARIEQELSSVGRLGIETRLRAQIGGEELKKLLSEYDAVFLGTGVWEKPLSADPETLQVSGQPIFAGGALTDRSGSVISAVSSGKRAAVSIERFVQKISMTASREREGSFETPMKYNLEDVEPAPRVKKTQEIYTKEEAAREAKRCLKCKCEECVKACSHLQKFHVTPKSYGRQIQINENVIMGTRYANKMINSCTMCGLCGERCPSGIGLNELVHQTRESMVEKGKMPVSAHDFALKDMEYSNSSRFFMVKSPPPIPKELSEERKKELFTYPRIAFSKYAQSIFKGDAPGEEKADYLFYPGCQLSASSPDYVEKAYGYLLSRIKEGVGLMLGCCGAPADWAGRRDLMEQSTGKLREAWERMGKPTFILACSSCCGVFEKYMPDIPFVSLWEIFDLYGLPETAPNGNGKVLSIHDACATRHNAKMQESLRRIAGRLGYEIRELKYTKEKTKCCGYGGLVYFANREQAEDFVKDRIGESEDDLLVYCAMCKDLFVEGGKRTYHILDLIFGEDLEAAARKRMPNLSQRQENRERLKRSLLRALWNEEAESEPVSMDNLVIPDEIWRTMEKRYILRENVEQVIRHAQETGERFFNPADSSFLASLRIENVTYWVRYREKDGTVSVEAVYSHRMEVVKE